MSLFGKMIPLKSQMQIQPEVRILLEGNLKEAGRRSSDRRIHEEKVDDLYRHLEVIMYCEILTHLPGKHLETFVEINDRNRTRAEVDGFLVKNMPDAEQILTDAVEKLRRSHVRKG